MGTGIEQPPAQPTGGNEEAVEESKKSLPEQPVELEEGARALAEPVPKIKETSELVEEKKQPGRRIKGLGAVVEALNPDEFEKEKALWEERVKIGKKRLAVARTDEQKSAAVRDIDAAAQELRIRENILWKIHKPQEEHSTLSPERAEATQRRIEQAINPRPTAPEPYRLRREAERRARQLERAANQPHKGSSAEVSTKGKGTSRKSKQARRRRELLNK